LVPEDVAKKSGFKLDQAAPIATVAELANYDAKFSALAPASVS
jgi:NAD(P)H dehydrogenase (quinone)